MFIIKVCNLESEGYIFNSSHSYLQITRRLFFLVHKQEKYRQAIQTRNAAKHIPNKQTCSRLPKQAVRLSKHATSCPIKECKQLSKDKLNSSQNTNWMQQCKQYKQAKQSTMQQIGQSSIQTAGNKYNSMVNQANKQGACLNILFIIFQNLANFSEKGEKHFSFIIERGERGEISPKLWERYKLAILPTGCQREKPRYNRKKTLDKRA